MLLRGFVLAALMFTSSVSLAAPTSEEVVFTQRDGFVTLRGENNLWVLEGFKIAKDGWQDSVWREAYPKVEQAQKRIKQLGLNASTAKTRSMILRQNGERELRTLANPPLWKVTQAWSWDWEKKYADWINAEVDPQFFVKYKIPTDCADVAYALRWIFARNNGLPAAVRLSGSGATFTQDSTRSEWLQFPTGGKWFEDKRFVKSLNWMTNNTYTHTLIHDSYPIAITQDALLAGSHHLALHEQSGHTQVIYRTFYNDSTMLPIRMMASTVPRAVRSLYETEFWESEQPTEKNGGILRFRWAVKSSSGTSMMPAASMPNFSKMQYAPEFMKEQGFFALAVLKSLNPSFTFESWLEKGLLSIREQIEARRLVVEEGAKVCATRNCAPGTAEYENWSTPSRDKRIRELYRQLLTVKGRIPDDLNQVWNKEMSTPAVNLAGIDYSLKHVIWTWERGMYSSEPQMPVDQRWGLEPVAFAKNMKLRLEQGLAEREAKIKKQGTVCRASGTCAIASLEWNTWNTFETDAHLVGLRIADQEYCTVAPTAACAGYSTARNLQTATGGGRTASLMQWLVDVVWLNADPRQSEAVRWGAMQNEFRWKLIPYGKGFSISKNGWILDSDNVDRLTNIDSGSVQMAPQGMTFTQLSEDGSRAFAKNDAGTEFLVLNLSTLAESRIVTDPTESIMIESKGIVVLNDAQDVVRVFSFSHDMTLPLVFQGAERVHYEESENIYFVKFVAPQPGIASFAIVDASTLSITPIQFKIGDKAGFSFVAKTRTHVLLQIWREDGTNAMIAINTVTNEVFDRSEMFGFERYLSGSGHVLLSIYHSQTKERHAMIASVDDSFKIQSQQTLGTYWYSLNAPLACADTIQNRELGKRTCFKYDGKSIDVRSTVLPGRTLTSWNDTHFVSYAKKDEAVALASWKDPSTAIASAPHIQMLGSGSIGLYPTDKPYFTHIDVNRIRLGTILTVGYVDLVPRAESTLGYNMSIISRGTMTTLASGDKVWIDQPAH